MSQTPQTAALPSIPRESVLAQRIRYLRELYGWRPLIRYLTGSSLRVESVNLSFGFLWWCLDPLLQMLVYTLVISVVLGRGTPNYPLFVMCAMLPWQFFVRATRNSIADTREKTRNMRQVAFPRAVIPLAATFAELIRVIAALGLFLVFAIPFGVTPSPTALLAVPLLALLVTTALGFAFFLSAFNLFVRDTEQAMAHVFRLWMFLAPVLYSTDRVPARFRLLFELNPLAGTLEGFRSVLFFHQVPAALPLIADAAGSLALLAVGFAFFVATERAFAKLA